MIISVSICQVPMLPTSLNSFEVQASTIRIKFKFKHVDALSPSLCPPLSSFRLFSLPCGPPCSSRTLAEALLLLPFAIPPSLSPSHSHIACPLTHPHKTYLSFVSLGAGRLLSRAGQSPCLNGLAGRLGMCDPESRPT